nr:DUF1343 domain-containing protein [Dysgonomonas sp. 520]
MPLIKNKRVALVVNQTSCLTNGTHLSDALLEKGISISKIFAPEHGFRGTAAAGEKIVDGKDPKTGLSVVSLYGKNYKPTKDQLNDVDIVIFDIQDVGARFYTYISTMHYVMEACAENGKKCIILDRPNPNDHIDGPVLNTRFSSFVGKHPIPVLHGLTVGELATMINGEGWLTGKINCDLEIVKVTGWKHGQAYSLPIAPSPNLPNDQAIRLYPSLCFFEATQVSVGRGTNFPFEVAGYPNPKFGKFKFTPKASTAGGSNPLQKGKLCYGIDLRKESTDGSLTLKYIIDFYKKSDSGGKFFSSPQFMDKLAGTDKLRLQILQGKNEKTIRASWATDLEEYKRMRNKYLLYFDNRYDINSYYGAGSKNMSSLRK